MRIMTQTEQKKQKLQIAEIEQITKPNTLDTLLEFRETERIVKF